MTRPKELYFTYASSKFQMMRDGFHQEYASYGITEEVEKEWLKELIEKQLSKLDINQKYSLFPLWYILQTNCISNYIANVIDFIENNMERAETKQNLNAFIAKTEEAIDRIDESCQRHMLETESLKIRLKSLNNR